MTVIVNPFDGGGYTLAEMTQAINLLPNVYTRLGKMGLFRFEGITQRTVVVEYAAGTISLLPVVPLGGPPTVAGRDGRKTTAFSVPWIPHDDVITPQDIQGIRAFGSAAAADPLSAVMLQKLNRMRLKHAQTVEYMEMNALRGILKSGSGATIKNYVSEFELAQVAVDFKLGTATTDINAKCREVLRHIESNLKGETMTKVLVFVEGGFFDRFTGHDKVAKAFENFNTANGQNPNRDDMRGGFPFGGLLFQEYTATVTLSDGTTSEKLVPANEGIAFPLGTAETFVTYGAPANLMETVNTMGLQMYARQIMRTDGSAVDIKTEASPIPINRRPDLVVRVYSSN